MFSFNPSGTPGVEIRARPGSTANANFVEPHAYLKRLFERLSHLSTAADYEEMLPWNIK